MNARGWIADLQSTAAFLLAPQAIDIRRIHPSRKH